MQEVFYSVLMVRIQLLYSLLGSLREPSVNFDYYFFINQYWSASTLIFLIHQVSVLRSSASWGKSPHSQQLGASFSPDDISPQWLSKEFFSPRCVQLLLVLSGSHHQVSLLVWGTHTPQQKSGILTRLHTLFLFLVLDWWSDEWIVHHWKGAKVPLYLYQASRPHAINLHKGSQAFVFCSSDIKIHPHQKKCSLQICRE